MFLNNKTFISALLIILVYLSSCDGLKENGKFQAPLFDNLGDHTLEITTDSKYSQLFFNQGLNLAYGFNHAEAERAYHEAIRQDSTNAMAYWGVAYVLGTNYNAVMDAAVKKRAQEFTEKAVLHSIESSDWERDLIKASKLRFDYNRERDQSSLDKQYAESMRKVYADYSDNDDISVFFAEALMNIHPWDLYTRRGIAKPWTPEIVAILEKVLERNPNHPGANHLYIHAVEASSTPERGLPNADRLVDLMPGAGHLVHMPSHIYIRTGHYHKGSEVNELASIVDSLYIASCNAQGVYPLAYYPHNLHFLAATSAYEGRGETSINAAFRVAAHTDTTLMREPGMQTLQHYLMIPLYVLVKFGQWDHILSMEKPAEDLVYPQAVWHYARGMAFVNKNQILKAKTEWQALKEISKDENLNSITIWEINSVGGLIGIALRILEAELLRQSGDVETAIAFMREAVEIEDKLNYNEPPDWFFSTRHILGSLLLANKEFEEAEKVYIEDLFFLPENGWALNGLYLSLMGQQKLKEALEVSSRLDKAWKHADIKLKDSMVEPIAYSDIRDNPFLDDFMANIPKSVMCGPRLSTK